MATSALQKKLRAEFYWRAVSPDWRPATPPSELRDHYDFVIVGGGFTGLWAAFHILEREPTASVALLEAERVGFGASSRNAGYLTPSVGPSYRELMNMGDLDEMGAFARYGEDNVGAVIKRITEMGIDCDLVETDLLRASTHPEFDRRIEKDLAAAEKLGVKLEPLDTQQLRSRLASPILTRGYAEPGALLNPMKFVHGLASALESRGLSIFEDQQVKSVDPFEDGCKVVTAKRTLRAGRVFLARNAWASRDNRLAPPVTPTYTYLCVTPPLTDAQWDEIGWKGGEGFQDAQWLVVGWRPTADRRIAVVGGAEVSPGARISPRYDTDKHTLRRNRELFEALFPQLRSVPFEMTWGGPVALTPDQIPKVGLLHDGRVAFSHGYNGHGVTLSYMCTAAALDLMFGEKTDLSRMMFTRNLGLRYPPEPFRWLGGKATTSSLHRMDDAIMRGAKGERPPHLLRIANRILSYIRVPWSQ